MENIVIKFRIVFECETETWYQLDYNNECYVIFAKHDGFFRNELYECEKEIPEELLDLVESKITQNSREWNKKRREEEINHE